MDIRRVNLGRVYGIVTVVYMSTSAMTPSGDCRSTLRLRAWTLGHAMVSPYPYPLYSLISLCIDTTVIILTTLHYLTICIGKQLTAVILPSNEIVQVNSHKAYEVKT